MIILKENEEKRIQSGHLWIFSNEIKEIKGGPLIGDIEELYDNSGRFLGMGFYNPHSLIAFRLLTKEKKNIGIEFWQEKIKAADNFRKEIYPGLNSYRAVFGESDGLPGLIVDKYESYLSVQFLSAGLEKNKEHIIEALKKIFNPSGIIARNDSGLRKLEGLEEKIEVLFGEIPEKVKIFDGVCSFWVNLNSGQKTGFFFDQRENRIALSKYCKSKKVLDCFCHTGAFGLHALKNGAERCVWIDSSNMALNFAKENAELNGYADKFNGIETDVSKFLTELSTSGNEFDIINLDPPALIKSKKYFHAGYKMYRKFNTAAMKNLKTGGILATSSCSHNLSPEDFRKMLKESAAAAGKQVRLLELKFQGRDHPIMLSMTETEYLKFAILQIL